MGTSVKTNQPARSRRAEASAATTPSRHDPYRSAKSAANTAQASVAITSSDRGER
jgi:hypothetical protein